MSKSKHSLSRKTLVIWLLYESICTEASHVCPPSFCVCIGIQIHSAVIALGVPPPVVMYFLYMPMSNGLPDPKGLLCSELLSAHFSRTYLLWQFNNSLASEVAFVQLHIMSTAATAVSHMWWTSHPLIHSFFSCFTSMSPSLWCQLFVVSNIGGRQIFCGYM